MSIFRAVASGDEVEFHAFKTVCPRCGVFSNCPAATVLAVQQPGQITIALLQCQACNGVIAVEAEHLNDKRFRVLHVWPLAAPEGLADAPEEVAQALQEARICRTAGAVTAGALVSRRAIEMIVRDRGQTEGGLRARIARLDITGDLKRIADGVRLIGDEAAHPGGDAWNQVTVDDLDMVIDLAVELIGQIYVMPKRVSALAERTRAMGRGEPHPRS